MSLAVNGFIQIPSRPSCCFPCVRKKGGTLISLKFLLRYISQSFRYIFTYLLILALKCVFFYGIGTFTSEHILLQQFIFLGFFNTKAGYFFKPILKRSKNIFSLNFFPDNVLREQLVENNKKNKLNNTV